MNVKPDFAAITSLELRAYVLAHRDDEEALPIYLDKRRTENLNPLVYQPGDDVAALIAEYLQSKKQS
jgi:hypothetical protein